MSLTAGVIAVQGDVSEHAAAIEAVAASQGHSIDVREIRSGGIVPECDWLAIPGGESTTISRLLAREGIDDEVRAHVAADRPVLATCAGLIVLATCDDERVHDLGLIDATVRRNAFGRQRDSFEAPLDVTGLADPFHAVFIRAPVIESVGAADVLARHDGRPVAVRSGPIVGTAFHPELTDDDRIHRLVFGDR
ncbi:MAG: pyridoxal 5'-phosphate synthase glutaminase subunit PdxT [Halococcoides sp.]